MNRLTCDNPKNNLETLMNYAYAKDGMVYLRYAEGEPDVELCGYISRHCQVYGQCQVSAEDIMDGICMDCDCPLSILNTVAVQAAELRSMLAKYEDTGMEPCEYGAIAAAIEKKDQATKALRELFDIIGETNIGRLEKLVQADKSKTLAVLPCKVGDTVYQIRDKKHAKGRGISPRIVSAVIVYGDGSYSLLHQGMTDCHSAQLGKTWFITLKEAEAALTYNTQIPCKYGAKRHVNEIGEEEIYCEFNAQWMNVTLGDCLGNCEIEDELKGCDQG